MLSTLSYSEFNQIKDIAEHLQGYRNVYSDHLPERHPKKIKPSSYDALIDSENAYDFSKGLEAERRLHNDHKHEYHNGGGLLETLNVVGNYAWELYNPLPEPFKWVVDKFLHRDQSREMTQQDRENADILGDTYNSMSERSNTIDDFVRLPEYDTEYYTAYDTESYTEYYTE